MSIHPNSFTRTQRKILPYQFTRLENGNIRISMLGGKMLIVNLEEAERILGREDLNMQKRKMYQAVLEWNDDQDVQQ